MRACLLLVLPACAAQHLAVHEWRDRPPPAPCEVHIVDRDGQGDFARTERYDAAGHLVFGTMRLTYDGSGVERLTWNGDRVVAIETLYDQEARRGGCDVEGGCDQPRTRTIHRTTYRHDGAKLVEEAITKSEYALARGTDDDWVLHNRELHTRRFRYDRERLTAVFVEVNGARGTHEFDYAGDRAVARRAGKLRNTFEWAGDRLVAYRWGDYTQRFDHDAEGRLIREVLSSADSAHAGPKTTTWTYDAGRLVTKVETSSPMDERVTSYTYDDAGRLIQTIMGLTRQTRRYTGTCAKDLARPLAPTALQRADATVCARSPGRLFNTCATDI